MRIKLAVFLLFIFGLTTVSHAEVEFPVQVRLFAAGTNTDPKNLNAELQSQGIERYETVYSFGIEANRPLTSFLNLGINYRKRYFATKENPDNPATEYEASLNQDALQLIARVPILRGKILRFDLHGGIGGTNTRFKLRTATNHGELSKTKSNDWFASLYSTYGASVGAGFKNFFFFIEGGMEQNKVKNFDRSGTISNNITELDLSGSYVAVGFMFDGVKARKSR